MSMPMNGSPEAHSRDAGIQGIGLIVVSAPAGFDTVRVVIVIVPYIDGGERVRGAAI